MDQQFSNLSAKHFPQPTDSRMLMVGLNPLREL
jgi:hypothetical protein